jgi:hypothetical protein
MDINQAKWFLRVFADGKKLNAVTIKELYLSGYIGIELRSPGKEPLPTVITEKGKRVLEATSLGFIHFSNPAIGSSA